METQTKVIGESSYTVTQMPAKTGRKIFARLMNILAPALKALPTEGAASAVDWGGFLAGLLGNPELEHHLDYFCDSFAAFTLVTTGTSTQPLHKEGVFDIHFAGKYADMVQWLRFSFEVNLGDFFTKVLAGGVFPGLAPKQASGSATRSPEQSETSG